MDLAPKELQFLSIPAILGESISILKRSPETFYSNTRDLIWSLSLLMLGDSLITHTLFSLLQTTCHDPSQTVLVWTIFLVAKFVSLILISAFSLLSTAAVVFTVASLYTSRPVSFSKTSSAIPKFYKRLFLTFLWILLLMIAYNLVFGLGLLLIIIAIDAKNPVLLFFAFTVLLVLFLVVHVYITALWQLASVVSVLEADYGFAAIKKSYKLLKGRTKQAAFLVLIYLMCCAVVEGMVIAIMEHGVNWWFTESVVYALLGEVLTVVNLVGFSMQNLFYFVCKSYHHQEIDKSALLGATLESMCL